MLLIFKKDNDLSLFVSCHKLCHKVLTNVSHTTFSDSVPGNFFLFGRKNFSLWRKNGAVEREKVHDLVKFCLFLLCHFGYIL